MRTRISLQTKEELLESTKGGCEKELRDMDSTARRLGWTSRFDEGETVRFLENDKGGPGGPPFLFLLNENSVATLLHLRLVL